jgi:hypothetical protein
VAREADKWQERPASEHSLSKPEERPTCGKRGRQVARRPTSGRKRGQPVAREAREADNRALPDSVSKPEERPTSHGVAREANKWRERPTNLSCLTESQAGQWPLHWPDQPGSNTESGPQYNSEAARDRPFDLSCRSRTTRQEAVQRGKSTTSTTRQEYN